MPALAVKTIENVMIFIKGIRGPIASIEAGQAIGVAFNQGEVPGCLMGTPEIYGQIRSKVKSKGRAVFTRGRPALGKEIDGLIQIQNRRHRHPEAVRGNGNRDRTRRIHGRRGRLSPSVQGRGRPPGRIVVDQLRDRVKDSWTRAQDAATGRRGRDPLQCRNLRTGPNAAALEIERAGRRTGPGSHPEKSIALKGYYGRAGNQIN